jgi:hypothetical protein
MIRLIYSSVRSFLWDEKVAASSLRSLLTFVASSVAIVTASASDATGGINVEIIRQWDWQAWAIRLGAAALAAGAVRIRAGDKNEPASAPPPAPPAAP